MKKILFYSFILILFSLISVVNGDTFDFYSDNRFSTKANGRGYTGIANIDGISNVILNPASLDIKNELQVHFEYVYKNTVPWLIEDWYLKPLSPIFLAGCGIPINKYFQTGVVYYIKNSYQLEMKTVIEMSPGGDIENVYQSDEEKIYSLLIPFTVKYKNIRFGVNLDSLNYVFTSRVIMEGKVYYNLSAEGKFEKLVPKFGVIFSPNESLSIGITFVPETEETMKVNKKSNISGEYVEEEHIIFPLKLAVGIKHKPKVLPIWYYIDCNYSNESKIDKSFVDRIDFHFGLDYEISNKLILRTGVFTQKDYRSEDTKKSFGSIDQVFATFGFSYKIGVIELNFSLMDSHLFSFGEIKQTYANCGLSFNF